MERAITSPRTPVRPRPRRRTTGILCSILAITVNSCIAAGPYPEPLSNSKDIRAAKPTLDYIDIRYLPLADFPLLAKFQSLKRVRFYNREGEGATDEKLKALADIGFTNLTYINLNNCRPVTDKGIEALSKIRSLRQLTLEGTAITDTACHIMASQMSLTSVQISNCSGVTKKGIEELARSKTLEYFFFSCDALTQGEVLALIDSFNSITWCEIVDTQGKLDATAIKKKGAEKKIHVAVRPTGALQDMRL